MERFTKKVNGLNQFCKNVPSKMFVRVLNTPLNILIETHLKFIIPTKQYQFLYLDEQFHRTCLTKLLNKILKRKLKYTRAIFFRAVPFSSRTSTIKQEIPRYQLIRRDGDYYILSLQNILFNCMATNYQKSISKLYNLLIGYNNKLIGLNSLFNHAAINMLDAGFVYLMCGN